MIVTAEARDGTRKRPRILAVVVSKEEAPQTYASLLHQTVEPEAVILADRVFPGYWVYSLTRAINEAISSVDLSAYDYVVRVEGDTVLPENWIEANLRLGADVVATGGPSMLIRARVLERMGSWPEVPFREDGYFVYRARQLGFSHARPVVAAVKVRRTGKRYTVFDCIQEGFASYQIGYEPLHQLGYSLHALRDRHSPMVLVSLAAYSVALLSRRRLWETARMVRWLQLSSLSRRLRSGRAL